VANGTLPTSRILKGRGQSHNPLALQSGGCEFEATRPRLRRLPGSKNRSRRPDCSLTEHGHETGFWEITPDKSASVPESRDRVGQQKRTLGRLSLLILVGGVPGAPGLNLDGGFALKRNLTVLHTALVVDNHGGTGAGGLCSCPQAGSLIEIVKHKRDLGAVRALSLPACTGKGHSERYIYAGAEAPRDIESPGIRSKD
jgi:hypothetical protein